MKWIARRPLPSYPVWAIKVYLRGLAPCVAFIGAIACTPSSHAGTPVHLGLPAVPASAEQASPAGIALGRRLFFDKRLSRDGTVSCASCHQPERAFTDGVTTAKGIEQKL